MYSCHFVISKDLALSLLHSGHGGKNNGVSLILSMVAMRIGKDPSLYCMVGEWTGDRLWWARIKPKGPRGHGGINNGDFLTLRRGNDDSPLSLSQLCLSLSHTLTLCQSDSRLRE